MRFLLDHNVPAAVGHMLAGRGHDAITVTDILPQHAEDPVVAAAAIEQSRVLISHDRDMRKVERLISEGFRARYPTLCRLHLSCAEPVSADRLASFMDVIEAEFACLQALGLPMTIEVGDRRTRLIR